MTVGIGLLCAGQTFIRAQESNSVPKPIVSKTHNNDEKTDWVAKAKRILEIGGEDRKTEDRKAKAYKELASLKPSADGDPRSVYAFILVGMVEKQWQNAQKYSAELLERNENYIPARASNIRTLLMLDKKLPAIAEMETLAKGLATASPNVTPDQLESAARFLGLAVGYFEGPAKELVKATALNALLATTEKIPQTLKGPFSEARSAIGEEYRMLVDNGEEALKKLRGDASKDAEQKQAELEADRKKIQENAAAAKQSLELKWNQSKANWDRVWAQCQEYSRNANILQVQINQIENNRSLFPAPVPDKQGKVDPVAQQQYLRSKAQADTQVTTLSLQLNQLSTQYDVASRNGMVIENQMNVLRNEAEKQGMTLAAQSDSFAKLEKMVRGKAQKEAKKAEPKLSGAKLKHARAFTTYDDFNFHKEQSLLIDSFPEN